MELKTITTAGVKRIMLVNDCDDVGLSFKIVLEEYYHGDYGCSLKVHTFTNPLDALDNFKAGLYDLVIIDILMPKMNGFELYDKLRELDGEIKVLFLTATGEICYIEFIKETFPGSNEKDLFIRIPVANQDLIKQVREVLYAS